MTAKNPTVPDELTDSTISETDLLGTHEYTNVLFTGPGCVDAVNVLTGEVPTELDRSVRDAIEHAENCTDDVPYVAKRSRTETAIETRSPYSACVFYHFSITGNMDWHSAFAAAYDDPTYTVTHDADYTTGDLTITVTENE